MFIKNKLFTCETFRKDLCQKRFGQIMKETLNTTEYAKDSPRQSRFY